MRDELVTALGEEAVAAVAGRAAVTLQTATAARELTALCRARGWRLHPWAGGPPAPDLPAEAVLVRPGGEIAGEFRLAAEDYYCEVPAPLTLAELRERLAAERRWFPFACPGGGAMTAGEVVARYPANAFGRAHGELPRLLLGVVFLNDEGDVVATGRRTLKGVAGYDLAKLFLGSRGRTGLILRARFRLFRRPPQAAFWRARGGEAGRYRSESRLCAVEAGGETLLYADGPAADVEALAARLREAGCRFAGDERGAEAARAFAEAVEALPPPAPGPPPPAGPALTELFI
ncbi:MAG: hypothetical protein JSU81_00730 [Candidatus Coatesbacteria bacterium]|nr:MAG: hypothetical protein JSU81_00730 [Candidatus Coatesbacteria bacterium]